jgi:hypothetical protein
MLQYCTYTGRRALSSEYMDAGLNVYVTSDNSDVYEDKFKKIACGESDCVQPTLILLGVRLGIDRVTPVYWKSLTDLLKYPQSVGIAGYVPMLQLAKESLLCIEWLIIIYILEADLQRRITLSVFKTHLSFI